MRRFTSKLAAIVSLLAGVPLSGCAFLPGFGIFEDTALYYLPVADVATQVACELQAFMREHDKDPKWRQQRWVLADEDVSISLNLQTDTSGNVNFTGVNVAALGFSSLQAFIASTTSGKASVSSLAAKLQAKRTRTVKIAFSVGANALDPDISLDPSDNTVKAISCIAWQNKTNLLTRLYLRDWLDNYFETINYGYVSPKPQDYFTDKLLSSIRPALRPDQLPTQFKIQTVELTSALQILVDVNGGATPSLLGNGTAFLLPVSGTSLDFSPDYSHTIDITLKICNNTTPTTCYPRNLQVPPISTLMKEQCSLYAHLAPLLSGVTVRQPKDGVEGGVHKQCGPDGTYQPIKQKVVRQT